MLVDIYYFKASAVGYRHITHYIFLQLDKRDIGTFFTRQRDLLEKFSLGGENSDRSFLMPGKPQPPVAVAAHPVHPEIIEMLEDLIVAATNEALRKVEEESAAVMSKLTGGLGGLGGGLPF